MTINFILVFPVRIKINYYNIAIVYNAHNAVGHNIAHVQFLSRRPEWHAVLPTLSFMFIGRPVASDRSS